MPRHIALLRGINVGGHRVKMDHLRALFFELGYTDVTTFIASGNVIFSADEEDADLLSAQIETHLAQALGFEVKTFIRSPENLRKAAEFVPAGHGDERALYVVFLKAAPDDAMRSRFAEIDSDSDRFTFTGREIYWSIEGKLSESPLFGSGLAKALGDVSSTSRNTTSVRKLVAKLG